MCVAYAEIDARNPAAPPVVLRTANLDWTALSHSQLAAGGLWMESIGEGPAADRFYLAILWRCNRTALGREADKSGAIPGSAYDEQP